jgi:hypothetical protein
VPEACPVVDGKRQAGAPPPGLFATTASEWRARASSRNGPLKIMN